MSRYHYIKPIGQGTSGQSYLAEDPQTGQKVVVKRFFHATGQSIEREYSFLKNLSHFAIPKYIDSFIEDVDMVPRFHLVTEYVEAQSLAELSSKMDVWNIAYQALEVLEYLHSQQPPVIHRDIKASNLLWTHDQRLMVIDFGCATFAREKSVGHTIMTGTLGYQAPEQIQGNPVPQSDLYSLGVVLIEKISGRKSFSMLSGQVLDWEEQIDILPIARLWLRKILHPNPEERFSSAEEAKYELEPVRKALKDQSQVSIHDPQHWVELFSQPVDSQTKDKWKGWVLLQERATKGKEWQIIAECWKILGESEAASLARDKYQKWVRGQLMQQVMSLRGLGLLIDIDSLMKSHSMSVLRQELSEDEANILALSNNPPLYELRIILKRLAGRYQESALASICEGLEQAQSLESIQDLEELYEEIGFLDRRKQLRFLYSKRLSQKAQDIQDQLAKFDVNIDFSIPIRPFAIEEAEEKLEQQYQLQERAEELARKYSDRGLSWNPLLLPLSRLEIEKREDLLLSQADLQGKWKHLKDRALNIDWQPKNIMLSPVALEAFRAALEQQEEYFARLKAATVRSKDTLAWNPKMPQAPYADPEDYEQKVQEQLMYHAQLIVQWEMLPKAVRRLIAKPNPPYDEQQLESFFAQAQELSKNRLAERILKHRKWGIVLAPIFGVLLYFGFQQWNLQQEVQALHGRFPHVGESFPHPSCIDCPPLSWPGFPYQKTEIDAFNTHLLEHQQRMKRFQKLVSAAEAVEINTEAFEKDPSLLQEETLEKIVKEQYVSPEKFYLLRRDAERLRLPTSDWSLPVTTRQYQERFEMVQEAQKLFDEAQELSLAVRQAIPFVYPITHKQLVTWKGRIANISKVQKTFASYEKMERGEVQVLRREITQELYNLVMEENPSIHIDEKKSVHNINWFDAVTFADRLNWYLQLPSCYVLSAEDVRWTEECSSWRLPTKKEWFTLAKNTKRGNTWERQNFRFPKTGAFYGDLWEFVWDRYEEELLPSRPLIVGGDWNTPRKRVLRSVSLYEKGVNIGFRLVRSSLQEPIQQPDQSRRPFFEVETISDEELLAKKAYRVRLSRSNNTQISRVYAGLLEEYGFFAEAEEYYDFAQASLCLPSETRRVMKDGCDPFLIEETHWKTKEKGSLALLEGQYGLAQRLFGSCAGEDITCLFAQVRVMLMMGQNDDASALYCVLTPSQRKNSRIALSCDDFTITFPRAPVTGSEENPDIQP